MYEAREELQRAFEFAAELFEHCAIERLARNFMHLLEQDVQHPQPPLREFWVEQHRSAWAGGQDQTIFNGP